MQQALLADMAVRYVSHAISKDGMEGCGTNGVVRSGGAGVNGHSTPIIDVANISPVEAVQDVEDLDKDIDSMTAELDGVGLDADGGPSLVIPERSVDLGQLLDTVLTTLPEEAYNLPSLTMEWLTKVTLSPDYEDPTD